MKATLIGVTDHLPHGHDTWRNQVKERMPLLSSKGILEVEVVMQRHCVARVDETI